MSDPWEMQKAGELVWIYSRGLVVPSGVGGLPGKFCNRGLATVELLGTGPWPAGTKDSLGRLCDKELAKLLVGRGTVRPFWDDGPMEATLF